MISVRRCGAFVAAFVCVSGAAPAAADDAPIVPTLAELQAHVRAAAGTPPTAEKAVLHYMRGGVKGTQTRIESGADYRVDDVFGPATTAAGRSHGVAWHQNSNGETIPGSDTPEPLDEARTASVVRVATPVDAYVVSDLTPLGFGIKRYIDPQTWRIVRADLVSPTGTRTTTFSDFRTTAGFTEAWHTTSTDGHSENDSSTTVESISTAPIAPAAFAIPPDARKLVEFPAGSSSVELPVRYDPFQHKFIVRLTIAGRGLDFLLDTGAGGIVISRDVSRQLGLADYVTFSNSANAGRFVATRTIIPDMSVGPLHLHNVHAATVPTVLYQGGDYAVVGLLGFDFIDAIGLRLDYENGTATAYDPATFAMPAAEKMLDLDLNLSHDSPDVAVDVNGAVGTHFTVDTGGAGPLIITDYFRRRNAAALVDESHKDRVVRLNGVGGAFDARIVKLAHIGLGHVGFTDYDALIISEAKLYAGGQNDGLVGPGLLRLFTVYFDYRHHTMRLIPNDLGSGSIVP